MKRVLMSVLLVMIIGVCGISVACSDNYSAAQIVSAKSEYEMVLSSDGVSSEQLQFHVRIDNVEDISLYYYLKNEGVIKVGLEKVSANEYLISVQAVKPGECTITLFLAEDSNVKKDILIKVVQPIRSISIKQGYEYFAKIGEKTSLNLGSNLLVEPSNASTSSVKYSLINSFANSGITISGGVKI